MLRDLAYTKRRALQERQAAALSTNERAQKIHADLARRYEEILRAYGHPDEAA